MVKGLRACDHELYLNGWMLILSSHKLEYIVELHDTHHDSMAKTDPELIQRTCVQDAHRKLAEVRRHCHTCQSATHQNQLPEGKLAPHPVSARPSSSLSMDNFTRQTGLLVGWAA